MATQMKTSISSTEVISLVHALHVPQNQVFTFPTVISCNMESVHVTLPIPNPLVTMAKDNYIPFNISKIRLYLQKKSHTLPSPALDSDP